MYFFLVLVLMGAQASGAAKLTFIFPGSEKSKVVGEVEKVEEPLVKVGGVVEEAGKLKIGLISREKIDIGFEVFYNDGSIESFDSCSVDGVKKLEIPIVLSGSKRKIGWVNIFWESGSLVVCSASGDGLPDLSLSAIRKFKKE